jgi:hypothetical protein
MPLSRHHDANAFSDPSTLAIIFHMIEDQSDREVRVTVQPAAVLALQGGANPISAFEMNRTKIETIASDKFDRQSAATEVVVREEDVAAIDGSVRANADAGRGQP